MSKKNPNNGITLPTCAYEYIEVNTAKEWLENFNTNNRKKRETLAVKYTRERVNGKQLIGYHALAFDTNRILMNGQHSLEGIIRSGIPEWHLVVRGLDPKVRMVGDTDAPRRPADILKLMGYEVSFTEVAIVRALMNGTVRRATMTEIVEAWETHQEAAQEAYRMFPQPKKRHISIAYVMAPLARAWYTHDRERLQKFADVLYSGLATRKGDLSVILLRDYLLQLPGIGGDQMQKEIYAKTESALRAFLDKTNLTKLVATKEELFPFPGEKEPEVVARPKGRLKIVA
jgi:hypothetical protein